MLTYVNARIWKMRYTEIKYVNKRMIAEQKVIQTVQAVILGRKGRAVTIVQGMPESNVLKEGTS